MRRSRRFAFTDDQSSAYLIHSPSVRHHSLLEFALSSRECPHHHSFGPHQDEFLCPKSRFRRHFRPRLTEIPVRSDNGLSEFVSGLQEQPGGNLLRAHPSVMLHEASIKAASRNVKIASCEKAIKEMRRALTIERITPENIFPDQILHSDDNEWLKGFRSKRAA
jgi:hypothetical protein